MDKRYQVFMSSTFSDLKEERSKIYQTLMEMDCIPAGMEMFPAADEEQWQFIKKIIDDCDYYLLLIGGRYGSLASDEISYTEKEYDYAVEKGIYIIAFLHEDPGQLPADKVDLESEKKKKLEKFKKKVSKNRLVKTWNSVEGLSGIVALSLNKAIKTNPAVGWVRSNTVGNTELLQQINELRQKNDELSKNQKDDRSIFPQINDLASGEDEVNISGTYKFVNHPSEKWDCNVSWNYILTCIGPKLLDGLGELSIQKLLGNSILSKYDVIDHATESTRIDEDSFSTIKIQFLALDYISTTFDDEAKVPNQKIWNLTEKGKLLLFELKTIKSNNS